MTNECRPPDGTADESYHWLKSTCGRHPFEWDQGYWKIFGRRCDPILAHFCGWHYLTPCLPPENADE